jgi:hypothetical protein
VIEPKDIEPEVELFNARNIDHARKLAAALWAVDVTIETVDAPPAERWTMRDAAGNHVGHSLVTKASREVQLPAAMRVATANGEQLTLGEQCDVVPMKEVRWVATFDGHAYGTSIVVPAEVAAHALEEVAANMVQTMLAMVVNGTIKRAPVGN